MGASPVGVERLREPEVGRVVPRHHALGELKVNRGLEAKRLFRGILEPAVIRRFAIPLLEAAFDIDGRAAALDNFAVRARGGFQRHGIKSTRPIRDCDEFSE